MARRVLVVEDDASMRQLLVEALGRRGFELFAASSAEQALSELAQRELDVVLTDINMKGMSGLELCKAIVGRRPDIPVIVMTAFGSLDTAVAAIRAGAYDFITKPVEIDAVQLSLERAIEHRLLRAEVKRLRDVVGTTAFAGELLGESEAMKKVQALLQRIYENDASLLVTGESGTGKEVVARALHDRGPRRSGPFVAVNCAAMPEALLESELFGHAKGAFTDAQKARVGLFQRADRGTLFLDELAELPLGLQPKLLRALQERKVRPVGSNEELPFDVRVIAATNRDLEQMVEERAFREDLFFRINVIHLELPPLRARGNDVLMLAQHFVRQVAARTGKPVTSISAAAAAKLSRYDWPGNVRELQNSIERAVAFATLSELQPADLPEKIQNFVPGQTVFTREDELLPLEEVERRYILRVLEAVGGNRTHAAKVLGLDRKTLYRKLESYGQKE